MIFTASVSCSCVLLAMSTDFNLSYMSYFILINNERSSATDMCLQHLFALGIVLAFTLRSACTISSACTHNLEAVQWSNVIS